MIPFYLAILLILPTLVGAESFPRNSRVSGKGFPSYSQPNSDPVYHTFSICAIDLERGECGVAVTTRVPEVGRAVPWVKAGVGAVATQAFTVVRYGPDGLARMEKGAAPEEIIKELLKDDQMRERRQLAMIDMRGRTAVHTGAMCNAWAGHRVGKDYAAQGNLLVGAEVVDAVAESFEASEGMGIPLAQRLIAALEAGQAQGGDKRTGLLQSAAVLVASARATGRDGSGVIVNLQVAEHFEPVAELRRQYDTINRRLGYRSFHQIAGPDVLELKQMLHALGYFRKGGQMPTDASRFVYDVEAVAAVDAFRKEHSLPVPGDGLGHPAGIVDAEFVSILRSRFYKQGKP